MAPLTFRRLRIWNACVGVAQLVSGVAILVLSDYGARSKLPWYSNFVSSWSRDTDAELFYVPAPKKVASFTIAIYSGVFLLLSACQHLLVTLPGVNAAYNRLACSNKSPFRWAEYSVSASLMSVMIAQLSGVTDIHLLFAIFALSATTMMWGWQMEQSNGHRIPTYAYSATADPRTPPVELPSPVAHKDGTGYPPYPSVFITDSVHSSANGNGSQQQQLRVDWGPFLMGCWPFLAFSAITACYFFQAVANGDPPTFVWSIFFILFFLYCMFAVNQILQFKQVRGWRGFAKAEWWYMILSLTSKQLLAWIAYGGTKRFENE